jgi:hypothetical protein
MIPACNFRKKITVSAVFYIPIIQKNDVNMSRAYLYILCIIKYQHFIASLKIISLEIHNIYLLSTLILTYIHIDSDNLISLDKFYLLMTFLIMSALPALRYNNPQNPKSLSTRIDSLLHECDLLSENAHLQSEMSQNLSVFKESLAFLKTLDPTDHKRTNSSHKVEAYLKERFKSKDVSITDVMKTPHKHPLSFDSCKNTEVSGMLSKQKRKFGEFWNNAFYSFDDREKNKRLPEFEMKGIEKRRKESRLKKDRIGRTQELERIIKHYLGTKLGLDHSAEAVIRKNKRKYKEKKGKYENIAKEGEKNDWDRKKMNQNNGELKIETNGDYVKRRSSVGKSLDMKNSEDEYLRPEYMNYLHNPTTRLQLEKILISQHQKMRRKQIFIPDIN